MVDMSRYSIAALFINSLAAALCLKRIYFSFCKKIKTQDDIITLLKNKIDSLRNEITVLNIDLEQKNTEIDELKQSHNILLDKIDSFVNRSYEML